MYSDHSGQEARARAGKEGLTIASHWQIIRTIIADVADDFQKVLLLSAFKLYNTFAAALSGLAYLGVLLF